MVKTVSFLIDGFNLYHSLDELQGMTGKTVKWLDLNALCRKFIPHALTAVGPDHRVQVGRVHYFSAIAKHLRPTKPDVPARHELYIHALRASGVQVSLGQFKRKDARCPHCGKSYSRHEEKETDVAIGMKLLEVFATNECEVAILISGDTDLITAVRTVKRLFGDARKVGIAFPFNRRNVEPQNYADFYFNIKPKDIERSQFPSSFRSAEGDLLEKPRSW